MNMDTAEATSAEEAEEPVYVSIPRGGPIYVSDLVGSLTRVPDFESSLFHELQSLEAELCRDLSQLCDDDIDVSVDDLKIYTEEELVDMAMKEALDGEHEGKSSQDLEEQSHASNLSRRKGSTSTSLKSSDGSPENCVETVSKKNPSKRKRKKRRDLLSNQGNFIAKVQHLVEIKRKQEEEKLAVRLHSFNASCKINEHAIPSSEKTERMTSLRFTNTLPKIKSSKIPEHIAVLYPEVVLCIEVYHSRRTWVKTQEFLLLGRQTLTELKDNIHCTVDQVMHKAGQHDPSGYFLIEDVFCNDLRDPSAIDYSKPIFDWLRNSNEEALRKWEYITTGELLQKQRAIIGKVTVSQLPQFKAVDMRKTRFCDLKFRLGAGYLYCHQGECKHTIVIRDMRMIHPEDVQNRAAYPIVIFHKKLRVQKCQVCKIYRAEKVTLDDKWAKENPCYFCKNCYYLLHYNSDGSLIYGDFSVYDYIPDS